MIRLTDEEIKAIWKRCYAMPGEYGIHEAMQLISQAQIKKYQEFIRGKEE